METDRAMAIAGVAIMTATDTNREAVDTTATIATITTAAGIIIMTVAVVTTGMTTAITVTTAVDMAMATGVMHTVAAVVPVMRLLLQDGPPTVVMADITTCIFPTTILFMIPTAVVMCTGRIAGVSVAPCPLSWPV
jgi:hypothetical protein